MDEGSIHTSRSSLFRAAIASFIDERKAAKIKDGDADPLKAEKYGYNTWLADAARRVSQIQAVTHVLKAIHPDAKGSSLHVTPSSMAQHAEVGSHVLGAGYADDIVGNAAVLDVYKFLKREVEGKRLLDWLQANDADLLDALNNDPAIAQEWATAFKGLVRPAARLSSHALAKQVYWNVDLDPTDDSGFHLLQPLFPSSLAHAVHQDITAVRYGESNKLARQAKRKNEPYGGTYHDYRNLVLRKLGGTKPQNISQLNIDRGGVNYMLASLPPVWKQNTPRNFLNLGSVFERFRYFEGVPQSLGALCSLLESNPNSVKDTRERRRMIERDISQHLAAFGLTHRELFEPGWSRSPDCQLPVCEQLWLDPDRAGLPVREDHLEEDTAFIAESLRQDWPTQVENRFSNWLNDILRKRGLPVGDVEQAHWAKKAIIEADSPMPFSVLRSSDRGAEHV